MAREINVTRASLGTIISLGHVGENEATTINFYPTVFDGLGDDGFTDADVLQFELYMEQNGSSWQISADDLSIDTDPGGNVTFLQWVVKSTELQTAGRGLLQIKFSPGVNALEYSQLIDCVVERSIDAITSANPQIAPLYISAILSGLAAALNAIQKPGSATNGNIAIFNSGKEVVDSGKMFLPSTPGLTQQSTDNQIPTAAAVVDYLNNLISNFLQKGNESNILYGTDNQGAQQKLPYSEVAGNQEATIPIRTSNGRLKAQDPVDNEDCVTKSYAESNFAPKATYGYIPFNSTGGFDISPFNFNQVANNADYGGNYVSLSTWQSNMALIAFGTGTTNQGVLSLVSSLNNSDKASRMIFKANGDIAIERAYANDVSPDTRAMHINRFTVYIDDSPVATQAWVSDNFMLKCLLKGTKIAMADGTEKNIEDIQPGEEILSYNPTTQKLCTAIALSSYKTGSTSDYTRYTFQNGSHLTVYYDHGYYEAKKGFVGGIKEITNEKFGLGIDLQPTRFLQKEVVSFYGINQDHYNLLSSNNLYFANGILCGFTPSKKKSYYSRIKGKLPEQIENIFNNDAQDYTNFVKALENNEYQAEVSPYLVAYREAKRKVEHYKQCLASLDYQTIKYAEGLITEDELAGTVEKKELYRAKVNEFRPIYRENFRQIEAIKQKYRNGLDKRALFNQCCDRDNAAFDLFREWLAPKQNVTAAEASK